MSMASVEARKIGQEPVVCFSIALIGRVVKESSLGSPQWLPQTPSNTFSVATDIPLQNLDSNQTTLQP